jgi:hypothetical protein
VNVTAFGQQVEHDLLEGVIDLEGDLPRSQRFWLE